jgi:hypothetical protein
MADINRSCDGESEKVSGNEPTIKDLDSSSRAIISIRSATKIVNGAAHLAHPTAITKLKLSKVKRPSIVAFELMLPTLNQSVGSLSMVIERRRVCQPIMLVSDQLIGASGQRQESG